MSRLILGLQPVREAIRVHGKELERVLVQRTGSPRIDALSRFATDRGVAVERIPKAALDRLGRGVRHQGVAAHGPELTILSLADLRPQDDSPLVVLDGITDPQNFGAVIRSAVALSAGSLLWAEHHAAPLTPATFRASAGAVEHARLFRVRSLRDAVRRLDELGYTTLCLDPVGEAPLSELPIEPPIAIVVGAEDAGVQRAVRRVCRHRVHLKMSGAIQSLNASVAAAVALYDLACRPVEPPQSE
jgi:23S rRNA (guanosine2251-2'-O)-methyltransferase